MDNIREPSQCSQSPVVPAADAVETATPESGAPLAQVPDAALNQELRVCPKPLDLPPAPHSLLMNPHACEILADFRWQDYLGRYPDLAEHLPDEDAARKHFVYTGYAEGRLHSNPTRAPARSTRTATA